MNLKRKLELLASSVRSISQHDDEDAAVRHAALDAAAKVIEAEKVALDQRIAERAGEFADDSAAA